MKQFDRAMSFRPPAASPLTNFRTVTENTFRAVNIGLVNEMALMCAKLNVDVWEVLDAAASKPYGYMAFSPGPGIGGHCMQISLSASN